tara:strand:- start:3827 stop:4465 length:639 start_codon:yes stop_codon:yes gene_type:complete
MSTSNTDNHSKITELEVIIPKDKFNDMGFIFRKLMETSLDVLKAIADNSDKELVELVREFLPDLKNLTHPDIFLAKWGLTMAMINNSTTQEELPEVSTKKPVVKSPLEDEVNQSDADSVASSKSASKKIKKKIKLVKKPKTSTPKVEAETAEVVNTEAKSKTDKPKPKAIKKLRKIKLKKPGSPADSVSSDTSSVKSTPKKKIRLKKKKADN